MPIVATEIANEGIAAPENEVIIVAVEEEQFADRVIFLLENEKVRDRIGKNAIHFMEQFWTWEFHFEKLEKMMEQLTENKNVAVQNYYPF